MLSLCSAHVDELREEIARNGLLHLVAKDVDDLFWLQRLGERDPLYWAYQRIMMTLVFNLWVDLAEYGVSCPLCAVKMDVGEGMVSEIIDAAVKYEVRMAE